MKIAVTGATGFVGRSVLACLQARGHDPIPLVRRPVGLPHERVAPLTEQTDWTQALAGVEAIVHLAARVHVMRDEAAEPLAAYREVNRDGTILLARQAAGHGVRRFVFVSTIKVNGEKSVEGRPFRSDDPVSPTDPYAISKLEAEEALKALALDSGMDIVIVRAPLVYGPRVAGNFRSMMHLLERGLPLPLGLVRHNRRSLIGVDNLADLLATVVEHPAAANKLFLASDGEDVSTAELMQRLGKAMGRPARLVPVPPSLLTLLAHLVGRGAVADRLIGSLAVDTTELREILRWHPPIDLDDGLSRAAAHSGAGCDSPIVSEPGLVTGLVKRVMDLAAVVVLTPIALPLCLLLALIIRSDSKGNPLFAQERIGRHGRPFRMLKLRTMAADTADLPSHEAPATSITSIGLMLRRFKLDELPQLWNVLTGAMTLVGPRPCLPIQVELIAEREARGLFAIRPGITGPAQLGNIDMSDPVRLAQVEARYFCRSTTFSDIKIVLQTALGGGSGDPALIAGRSR